MAETRNLIPKTGLVVGAAFFVQCWVAVGDAGSVVGGPVEVLGVFGTILLYGAILLTLATVSIAAFRAHRAGSWSWFVGVVFFWPLSFLYALLVNRGD